jgi:hypothetical protein
MPNKTLVRVSLAGLLLALFMAGSATATPADLRTVFSFNGPVSIPGVTLPAGDYLFRVVESSHRDIIQVLNGEGTIPYSMFFASRATRSDVPTEPEISFMETAAGMPRAIRTLWYPGLRTGYEFVYPRSQARLLTNGTGVLLLTTVEETITPSETARAELARIEPFDGLGEMTEYVDVEPVEYGQVASPTLPVAEPTTLPSTASAMPSVGAAGVFLLLGTVLLGAWRVARA